MSSGDSGGNRPSPVLALCFAIIDIVGWMVPANFQHEWRREWRAELWAHAKERSGHSPSATQLVRTTIGTIPDAFSLWPWSLEILMNDLRFALRTYRRQLGFASAVVATIAVAVGASTAVFSVFSGVLLRPLPYAEPSRLVRLWAVNRSLGWDAAWVSPLDVADWSQQNKTLDKVAGYSTVLSGLTLTAGGDAERLPTAYVTADFFETLGAAPSRGRVLSPADSTEGDNHVVVLSDAVWRRRFGADSTIIGRSVRFDGESFIVVGIMPRGFDFPSAAVEVWAPHTLVRPDQIPRVRDVHWMGVIGRLRNGVSIPAAQTDLSSVAAALAKQYPQSNTGWNEVRIQGMLDAMVADARPALIALLIAVFLVTIMACVNVANLMLARSISRTREFAVRTALGAVHARLFRQLLTESLVLSVIGGAIGVVIAWRGVPALLTLAGGSIPRAGHVHMDWRVMLFAAVLSVLTGLLFGAVPAWRARRADLRSMLGDGGRGATGSATTQFLRSGLVVAQFALALALTSAAGLTLKSFKHLESVNPGFDTEHTLLAQFTIRMNRFKSPPEVLGFYRQVVERARTLPGVTAAGGTKTGPLLGAGEAFPFTVLGQAPPPAGSEPTTGWHPVTPGYFDAIGMRIESGRGFSDQDVATSERVAVINHTMAKRYWGNTNPIGKRLQYGGYKPLIVGVVNDVRQVYLDSLPRAELYVPVEQEPRVGVTLVVRTNGNPSAIAPALRAMLREMDPEMPVTYLGTTRAVVSTAMRAPRFVMVLLMVFGGCALVLATIGLYGVIAHGVNQRTQEIGIRVALGAGQSRVIGDVVKQALLLAAAGIGIGLLVSVAMSRVLTARLYEVQPTDPAIFAIIALMLAGVAMLASFLPARRAARIDPIEALRAG